MLASLFPPPQQASALFKRLWLVDVVAHGDLPGALALLDLTRQFSKRLDPVSPVALAATIDAFLSVRTWLHRMCSWDVTHLFVHRKLTTSARKAGVSCLICCR
jgi:hypothetical protein